MTKKNLIIKLWLSSSSTQEAKAGWLRVQGKPEVHSLVLGQAQIWSGTSIPFFSRKQNREVKSARALFSLSSIHMSPESQAHFNICPENNVIICDTFLKDKRN